MTRQQELQVEDLVNRGYTREDAVSFVQRNDYKTAVDLANDAARKGEALYKKPTSTITNGSPKDTAKSDREVEKEAEKLKSKVGSNQVNLVGTTASDSDIGKTGAQMQAEKTKQAAFMGDYDEWKKINEDAESGKKINEPLSDESSTSVTSSSNDVSTPKTFNSNKKESGATSRYTSNKTPYNQPMGIMDAYYSGRFGDKDALSKFEDAYRASHEGYDGDFSDLSGEDKEAYENAKQEARNARNSRDYYILDALAKYGNKLSDATGRIAAAYGGGSFTPSGDTQSAWEARNANLLKAGSEAETAGLEGSNQNITAEQAGQQTTSNAQAIEQKEYQLKPARIFAQVAANENAHPALRNLYSMLAGNAAGNDMDVADYIASYFAGDKDMQNLLSEVARSGSNMASVSASSLESINNLLEKLTKLTNK